MAIKFQSDKCGNLLMACGIIIVVLLWLGLLILMITDYTISNSRGWTIFFLFCFGIIAIFCLVFMPLIVLPWGDNANKCWDKCPKFSKGLAIIIVLTHYLTLVIIYSLDIYYNVINNKIIAEGGQPDLQPNINLVIAFCVLHGLLLCILIVWKTVGYTLDIDALSEKSKARETEKAKAREISRV